MVPGMKSRWPALLPASAVVCAMGITLSACSKGESKSAGTDSQDRIFETRRSDLLIGTLLRGAANAKNKHKLFPDASYKNTLTWIEEENSYVKAGDLVIQFETQDLEDDIEARELAIETRQRTLDIQLEERRVILSENLSSLRIARDSVVSAEEAYARYFKYDGKKKRQDLEAMVASSEKNLQEQRVAFRDLQNEISNTIYDSEEDRQKALEELDKLEADVDVKDRAHGDAVYNLRIFKRYTYPNTLTDLQNKLQQALLNLEKTEVSTASRVVQKDNQINQTENNLRKEKREFRRVSSYLPMMKVYAPADGILVYGDIDNRRNKIDIQIGMEVKRKQVMATIPEMDNLIVDFELPEQFRHRITKGAKALITPDSIPSLRISGVVSEVAIVPVNQISWDRTSPKVYHSVITLDEQHIDFVSGMSVQVEVIEEVIENALNIPVEAVFEEDGEYFVYASDAGRSRKQVVVLGKSNDRYVEILSGLEEGDEVYLYSPYELDAME